MHIRYLNAYSVRLTRAIMEATFRHISSGFSPDGEGHLYATPQVTSFFSGVLYNDDFSGVPDLEKVAAERVAALFLRGNPEAGLAQLDGSFLAIVQTGDYVYVVRDHHGTGPSFYYSSTHFSTSLHDLVSGGNLSPVPDQEALAHYLRLGYVPAPLSSFRDVSKLAGGMLLQHHIPTATSVVKTLYPYSEFHRKPDDLPLATFSEQYGALHLQAIQRRLKQRKSVGILLSGGYDSGSNLVALRKVWNGEVQSFSIGFRGNHWSELPVAREMSSIFDTRHSEYELDGSEVAFLPEIVKALGDPFVEGGLMVNYAAMKMAAGSAPDMILGGDGSDQYFGTSGREVALHLLSRRLLLYRPLIWMGNLLNREWVERGGAAFRARFHSKRITDIQAGDQFGFSDSQIKSLFSNPHSGLSHPVECPPLESFSQLYSYHHYYCDIRKTIDQVILYKASKMAAHFGNRLSYPFLDNDLYHFLQTVPVGFKCKADHLLALARGQGIAKFLLKYHYKPLLPASVTSKKKQGGFAPMALFFQDPVQRTRLADYILSSDLCHDLLDRNRVKQWLDGYNREASGEGGWFWYQQARSFQYFTLLNLAVWWNIFVSKKEEGLL